MVPLLQPGDEVLVDLRAYSQKRPRSGDVVVARHPHQVDLKIIKRVTDVVEDGRFYLQGDNPDPAASSDSRSFGLVSLEYILGRVTSRFG